MLLLLLFLLLLIIDGKGKAFSSSLSLSSSMVGGGGGGPGKGGGGKFTCYLAYHIFFGVFLHMTYLLLYNGRVVYVVLLYICIIRRRHRRDSTEFF